MGDEKGHTWKTFCVIPHRFGKKWTLFWWSINLVWEIKSHDRRKPDNPEKSSRSRGKNPQQTYSTKWQRVRNRTRATLVGGACYNHEANYGLLPNCSLLPIKASLGAKPSVQRKMSSMSMKIPNEFSFAWSKHHDSLWNRGNSETGYWLLWSGLKKLRYCVGSERNLRMANARNVSLQSFLKTRENECFSNRCWIMNKLKSV